MVDLQESILAEMDHRGRSMVLDELLALVERYHPTDGPGVPREVIDAYVAEMESRGFADAENLEATLRDRQTDGAGWAGEDAVYELDDDRLSVMPPRWHEKLGGSDDLRQYVEVMDADLAEADVQTTRGGAGTGVTKQLLVEAATILGEYDRASVRHELADLRERGELVEDASQHPQARIYTAE